MRDKSARVRSQQYGITVGAAATCKVQGGVTATQGTQQRMKQRSLVGIDKSLGPDSTFAEAAEGLVKLG
jgi:hypothetical protein